MQRITYLIVASITASTLWAGAVAGCRTHTNPPQLNPTCPPIPTLAITCPHLGWAALC